MSVSCRVGNGIYKLGVQKRELGWIQEMWGL